MSNPWQVTAAGVTADDWPDAAALAPTSLQERLDAAQAQCAAWAPAFDLTGRTLPADLPPGWRLAVVLQAREIHHASRRVGDSEPVGDVYAVRVAPLSAAVKALLRPATRTAVCG